MPDDNNWVAIFEFLSERFASQEPFTKEVLENETDWRGTTFPTHFSKRIKYVVVLGGDDLYRVGESFRPFVENWPKFQREVVTQVRRMSSDYTALAYGAVLPFEFFMPLTNETQLRNTLDALFYRDTILNRLRAVGLGELSTHITKQDSESDDEYLERVCHWIGKKFVGYSISHVSGRFRGGELSSIAEASRLLEKGGRYLIDETTAIVHFIFPCGEPARRDPPLKDYDLRLFPIDAHEVDEEVEKEAQLVRWFFGILFVESVVQAVNGEAEIWMIESGLRNALHIWKAED